MTIANDGCIIIIFWFSSRYIPYMGKFWLGKNWWIWQIVSHSPKFSLPIFTDTQKMYKAYALTVAYSPKFSSPKLLYAWFAKISPAKYFPCMVFERIECTIRVFWLKMLHKSSSRRHTQFMNIRVPQKYLVPMYK